MKFFSLMGLVYKFFLSFRMLCLDFSQMSLIAFYSIDLPISVSIIKIVALIFVHIVYSTVIWGIFLDCHLDPSMCASFFFSPLYLVPHISLGGY